MFLLFANHVSTILCMCNQNTIHSYGVTPCTLYLNKSFFILRGATRPLMCAAMFTSRDQEQLQKNSKI